MESYIVVAENRQDLEKYYYHHSPCGEYDGHLFTWTFFDDATTFDNLRNARKTMNHVIAYAVRDEWLDKYTLYIQKIITYD